MQRRKMILLAGGGAVVAAVGYALTPGFAVPASAVAAWNKPPADADPRRTLLSYALLAPNPHNMQPWIADLGTPGEILLRLDTARLLPETDPFGRQILMGVGAFLELLRMAAAEMGLRCDIALFPAGEPGATLDARPIARIRIATDAAIAPDPLFAYVLTRRTDRRAYDPARALVAADIAALQAAATALPVGFGLANNDARAIAIRAITREAWRIELTTAAPMMESIRVLRVGSAEIDRHRDGIAITSPLLVMLDKVGLFDRSTAPAPGSTAVTSQIASFDAITVATPGYLWITTEGNRRVQQIHAGRAYARVNLAGTAAGLAMHPNEQALQEYPQVAAQYRAIHAALDAPVPRLTVQMLARVGYLPAGMAAAEPAPRRGLAAHLAA